MVVLLALFVILNYFGSWFYSELTVYIKNSLGTAALTKELSETNLGNIMLQHGFFF